MAVDSWLWIPDCGLLAVEIMSFVKSKIFGQRPAHFGNLSDNGRVSGDSGVLWSTMDAPERLWQLSGGL